MAGDDEVADDEPRRARRLIPNRDPGPKARGRRYRQYVAVAAALTLLGVVIVWIFDREVIRDSGLWLFVIAVFFLALWMVVGERSTKEVGVALVTGLVLAGAAYVLNTLLGDAFDTRDRGQRETDIRLSINRQEQTTFRGEDLRYLDLSSLDMSAQPDDPFDLSFADLRDTLLRSAILHHAQLRRADLRGADLTGADLSFAVLRNAQLAGAKFCQADLSGADLTGATGFAASDGCDTDQGAVLDANSMCPGPEEGVGAGDGVTPAFLLGRFTCEEASSADCGAGDGDDNSDCGTTVDMLFLVSRDDPAGSVVGRVLGTSSDGDSLSYEIDESTCPDDAFAIDASNGVVETGPFFDGDTVDLSSECRLVVMVADEQQNVVEREMQIVFSAPQEDVPPETDATYVIRPDSGIGSTIGQVRPRKDPNDAPLIYTVIAPGDGRFRVESDTGVLILNHRPEPGSTHSVSIAICARDTGQDEGDEARCRETSQDDEPPFSATVSVRIMVLQDNTPPVIEGPERFTLRPGAEPVEVVGSVQATDPDSDDPLRYSLSSEAEDDQNCNDDREPIFAIDETGAITLVSDGPEQGACTVVVTVTDRGIPALSATVRIAIEVPAEESVEEEAAVSGLTTTVLPTDTGPTTGGRLAGGS